MNTYELEAEDVYSFCNNILRAHELGLNLDTEDYDFLNLIMEKIR